MADWYSFGPEGGADIPDQLARFLFLEEVLGGRRVLLVGSTAYALSGYLKELGARKVVCALEDAELVDEIRGEGAPDGVDVRLVRPGVLPGDDGAFDLVVDFRLPYEDDDARAARLAEIERLLSDDGFALTALPSGESAGLQGLLGEDVPAPRVEYRALAETLVERFPVVEVYFQSLLLGYFFGSFEVDPGEDGIAPHTGLMGEEPEPATTWIFAFGNAVPLLQDVTLVQLPFAPLVERVLEKLRGGDATAELPSPAVDARLVEELAHLKRENARKEHALLQLATRIPELKAEVDTLLLALESRTREREDLTAGVAHLQSAVLERDAEIFALHSELERAAAHAHALEERLTGGVDVLRERESWLEATRSEVAHLEAELEAARQALSEAEATTQALAQQVERAQSEKARMRERVVNVDEALREARAKHAELREQLEEARAQLAKRDDELARLRSAVDGAGDDHELALRRAEGARQELALRYEERGRELEKLALGVNKLMAERDGLKQRAKDTNARANELASRVAGLEQQLAEARRRHEETSAELALVKKEHDQLRDRLKAQQASLETRGRELGKATELFSDVAAQRDTLQKVVLTRDRELAEVKEELSEAMAELERLEEQAKAADKARADVERESASVIDRLKARIEDLTHALEQSEAKASELLDHQNRERAEHAATRDELERTTKELLAVVDEAEPLERENQRLDRELSELRARTDLLSASLYEAQRAAAKEAAGAAHARAALEEAQQRLAAERARGDLFQAQLEEARAAVEGALRAEGTAPDDELEQLRAENRRLKELLSPRERAGTR